MRFTGELGLMAATRLILFSGHGFILDRAFAGCLSAYRFTCGLTRHTDSGRFRYLGFDGVNDFHEFLSVVGTYRAINH